MIREEIRQAIIVITGSDPQGNFTILEKNKELTEFKVEINWTRSKKEVLIIRLKSL